MKKVILFVLCLIMAAPIFSQVKNAGCYLRMIQPAPTDSSSLSMENDSIKITFNFNSLNAFVAFSAYNKTDKPVQINWDKFCMVMEGESNNIIFDDTRMIDKDSSKGCSTIAPGAKLNKEIAPADYIDLGLSLYTKGRVKKSGSQDIGFIIPVIYGETEKIYNCIIKVSLQ